MKKYILTFALVGLVTLNITSAFAMRGDGGPRFNQVSAVKSEPVIMQWVGEVRDKPSSHTTNHEHNLIFTKKDDGEQFDIVDSPELVKLHHETEKSFLVEIEAEKTSRFLFWGGNLIVRKFRVVNELEGPIPHNAPVQEVAHHSGGLRR